MDDHCGGKDREVRMAYVGNLIVKRGDYFLYKDEGRVHRRGLILLNFPLQLEVGQA
jgi:hypothetical protein